MGDVIRAKGDTMTFQVDDSIVKGVQTAIFGGGILAAILAIWRFTIRLIGVPKRVSSLEKTQLIIISSLRSLTKATLAKIPSECDDETQEIKEDLASSLDDLNDHVDRLAMGVKDK